MYAPDPVNLGLFPRWSESYLHRAIPLSEWGQSGQLEFRVAKQESLHRCGFRSSRTRTLGGGNVMARAKKKTTKGGAAKKQGFSLWGDKKKTDEASEGLPKDEAGRLKIKRQYEELLGIRMGKLAGRVLNRERIDKTVEGIYFLCISCKQICHNLDEGLIEDPENQKNICKSCHKGPAPTRKADKPS